MKSGDPSNMVKVVLVSSNNLISGITSHKA